MSEAAAPPAFWRPAAWPLRVKLPLLAAALTVAVAVVISNLVLNRLSTDQTAALRQLTGAYLDGLSTALLPYVQREDVWESFDVLDRARDRYAGVKARYSLVALTDGTVLAASDPHRFPSGSPLPEELRARLSSGDALIIDEDEGLAWAGRTLEQEGMMLGKVVAEIDIRDMLVVRREVLLTLVLVNAGLTLLFAVAGYFAVRRMVRPIYVLTGHVDRIREGVVETIPAEHVRNPRTEFGRLFGSFNAMAAALREREALASRLAEEERVALLGRLASGMAHEVNNPLGGMLNLVDTMRRHGNNETVRQRSLDLLERGIRGIGNVVRATLTSYKGVPSTALTPSDLDDLQFLLQHETRRRHLRLSWRNALPASIDVDGAAVRQIALNLLLNACAASPDGGEVRFEAIEAEGHLSMRVADQGAGLPDDVAGFLRQPSVSHLPPPVGIVGLGIWTVCMLVARHGGRIVARDGDGDGADIAVTLPIRRESSLDAVA